MNKMDNAQNAPRRGYLVFLIVFLGMLSAFGPFVTDMYLPTLPAMARVFSTTASMVQMGLTASMIGLALGQLLFGPLSDRYGRKAVLFASLALFAVSTAFSIFSPTIEFFNVTRLFQGIGAAGGLVMSRSVATDCYSGRDLARTMAVIGAVNGVAPVTAPVVGGLVSAAVGWQGIFVILLFIGLALIAACCNFRETLQPEFRDRSGFGAIYGAFGRVLRLRRYVVFLIAFGAANGLLFGYISSAPFAVQTHFGLSEIGFAVVFAINSIAIGIGSGLSLKFKSILTAGRFGAVGMVLFAVAQFAGYLTVDALWCYEVTVFLMLLSLGFVLTSTTTLAMDAGRRYTGAASAAFGAFGFLVGGAVSPIVGLGDMMTSMSVTLVVSAVVTLVTLLTVSDEPAAASDNHAA
jgi:DHA1 family bicyclomycin/chloramphenicol resistance-like MFS transporter